jgi:hypothetical protein
MTTIREMDAPPEYTTQELAEITHLQKQLAAIEREAGELAQRLGHPPELWQGQRRLMRTPPPANPTEEERLRHRLAVLYRRDRDLDRAFRRRTTPRRVMAPRCARITLAEAAGNERRIGLMGTA